MSKPPVRTVWERVQEALEDARHPTNQRWIAKKLELSQPAVALWNKPGGFPTMDNAIALAGFLGVNVEWILTERGPKRPVPSDSYAQKLWAMWPELSDGDKRELFVRAEGWLQRRLIEAQEEHPETRISLNKP